MRRCEGGQVGVAAPPSLQRWQVKGRSVRADQSGAFHAGALFGQGHYFSALLADGYRWAPSSAPLPGCVLNVGGLSKCVFSRYSSHSKYQQYLSIYLLDLLGRKNQPQ